MSDTQPIDNSPFDGGPYADVLRTLRLPPSYTAAATARRIVVGVFVAWVPLVLLAALARILHKDPLSGRHVFALERRML
jgi:hypothetical protein